MDHRWKKLFTGVFLTFSMVAGCATSGIFKTDGFQHNRYGYVVMFKDPQEQSFLPSDWRLDNYTYAPASRKYSEKRQGSYMGIRRIDDDGDGVVERYSEPLYDLKFVHTRNDSTIWIKAHPVRPLDKDRDLQVVFDEYVDSLSGEGLYSQGSVFSVEEHKRRDFTPFVKDIQMITIDGLPAVQGVIELAEIEKLKAAPNYAPMKIKVVFSYFSYMEERSREILGWNKVQKRGRIYHIKKGLLVMGYINDVSKFDKSVGDFDALLQRVRFEDQNRLFPIDPAASATPAGSSSAAPAPSSSR